MICWGVCTLWMLVSTQISGQVLHLCFLSVTVGSAAAELLLSLQKPYCLCKQSKGEKLSEITSSNVKTNIAESEMWITDDPAEQGGGVLVLRLWHLGYIFWVLNGGFVIKRGQEMEREEQMVFKRRCGLWSSCPTPGETGLLFCSCMLEREREWWWTSDWLHSCVWACLFYIVRPPACHVELHWCLETYKFTSAVMMRTNGRMVWFCVEKGKHGHTQALM